MMMSIIGGNNSVARKAAIKSSQKTSAILPNKANKLSKMLGPDVP